MDFIRSFRIGAVMLASILFVNCTHKQVYRDLGAWSEKKEGSVQLAVRSIETKKNRVELTVTIKNGYPFSVFIAENSMRFQTNGDEGVGNGNPRWELKSGDIISYKIKFVLAAHEEGASTLRLEHIYKGSDTRGRLLPNAVLNIPNEELDNHAPVAPSNNGGFS